MQLRSLVLVVWLLLITRDVAAHGVPPAATALLAKDAEGALLVRL